MHNRSLFRALAVAALIAAGAAIGIGAYNAGVAQGIAQSGALTAPPAGAPYLVYPYLGYRPWGFGFFSFFLLLVPFFIIARILAWRGRWREGWSFRHDGVPPAFEEWHRRAHAERPAPPTTS